MFKHHDKSAMPNEDEVIIGRDIAIQVSEHHYVSGNRIINPFPDHTRQAMFGLGCFWGAEKIFWECNGVYSTMVGYAAGKTKNPTYEEVCSGMTGHNEVVRVIYDPKIISYKELLKVFWQAHNPTQGMRQGNDRGTQYRSGIYCGPEQTDQTEQIDKMGETSQMDEALESKTIYQNALLNNDLGMITTEIITMPEFYYAEDYHQQYLAKNPGGYCGLGGTNVAWPD
jgi:peptide-methionine (S)-S-oxide reductase